MRISVLCRIYARIKPSANPGKSPGPLGENGRLRAPPFVLVAAELLHRRSPPAMRSSYMTVLLSGAITVNFKTAPLRDLPSGLLGASSRAGYITDTKSLRTDVQPCLFQAGFHQSPTSTLVGEVKAVR